MPSPLTDADEFLSAEINDHRFGTRTQSAAMLAWFLESVWRIDPEDVDSAICDSGGDKGIDALLVDDDLNEVTVFQAKHHDHPDRRTVGDTDLKQLVGSAAWFESPEAIDELLEARPNQELRNLLARQDVRAKIANGNHVVKLVFVTNSELNPDAAVYAEAGRLRTPPLEVWERRKLTEVAERTRRPQLVPDEHVLHSNGRPIVLDLTSQARMAVCVVPARELVALPGISDRTLFSRNVRLYAGMTRINKELRSTVKDLGEHRLFPAYHNGLTLLTNRIAHVTEDSVTLDAVGVVNGCQSLITLYDNSNSITDELQLLVKVVEVASDNQVADLITYRSNNQNAVTLRDQRAGDSVMRDLQQSVAEEFGNQFALVVRVGETPDAQATLENTLAAQLIMAAYLKEPWSAVRKVRLFDQDYRRIFNRQVTPHRLYLLHIIDQAVIGQRNNLRPELNASFASIRFTLVHLVCAVLRLNNIGTELLDRPEAWLPAERHAVARALGEIAHEVVESANYHVETERDDDDSYDPKVVFKSRQGVTRIEVDVVRDAKRQAARSTSYLFTVTPAE